MADQCGVLGAGATSRLAEVFGALRVSRQDFGPRCCTFGHSSVKGVADYFSYERSLYSKHR